MSNNHGVYYESNWYSGTLTGQLCPCLFFPLAIAVNEVDDVRPVLTFYKAQRGEDKVLETYLLNQALLRAEEERRREQMDQLARQGAQRGLGGPISTFSLSRKHQVRNVTVLLFCVTRKCL